MPKILDVIIHGQFKQVSVLVDRVPDFKYKRVGDWLLASNDGWYDSLQIVPRSKWAFGGRKFDIPMEDGTQFHCHGQVWAAFLKEHAQEPTCSVGVATREQLDKCYVFMGGRVSATKLTDWLAENEPKCDYYFYDFAAKTRMAKYRAEMLNRDSLRPPTVATAATVEPVDEDESDADDDD